MQIVDVGNGTMHVASLRTKRCITLLFDCTNKGMKFQVGDCLLLTIEGESNIHGHKTVRDGDRVVEYPPMYFPYKAERLESILSCYFRFKMTDEDKNASALLFYASKRCVELPDHGQEMYNRIVRSAESGDFDRLEEIVIDLLKMYSNVKRPKYNIEEAMDSIGTIVQKLSTSVWFKCTKPIINGWGMDVRTYNNSMLNVSELYSRAMSGIINPYSMCHLPYEVCNRINQIAKVGGTVMYDDNALTPYLFAIIEKIENICETEGYTYIQFSRYVSIVNNVIPKIKTAIGPAPKDIEDDYATIEGVTFILETCFDLVIDTSRYEDADETEEDKVYTKRLHDVTEITYKAISDRVNKPYMKNGKTPKRDEVGIHPIIRTPYVPKRFLEDDCTTVTQLNIVEQVVEPVGILSELQLEAFRNAMNNCISILTGGAGTGKTRTIVEIVKALTNTGKRVQLTSKTGKAVARMKEMMDGANINITFLCEPRTLDKIIRTTDTFDYLIIDEASMLNTDTFSKFMSSRFSSVIFPILFVGDNNQLEPIGVGNLFFELYSSNCVPVTKLSHNFRIHGCGALMNNVMSIVSNDPKIEEGDDFILMPSLDEEDAMNKLTELVIKLKELGVKPEDLQILSLYNEPLEVLNHICIYAYFGELPTQQKPFVVGQRISVKHNNYSHGLFHGDVGIVVEITNSYVKVYFKHLKHGTIKEFRKPEYDKQKLSDTSVYLLWSMITHSHASTVHSSQGSEYHSVILYLQHREKICEKFLTYKLLYTALSRAQDAMYVIGDINLLTSCNEQSANMRLDTLCTRLRKRFGIKDAAEDIIANALDGDDEDMFGCEDY